MEVRNDVGQEAFSLGLGLTFFCFELLVLKVDQLLLFQNLLVFIWGYQLSQPVAGQLSAVGLDVFEDDQGVLSRPHEIVELL